MLSCTNMLTLATGSCVKAGYMQCCEDSICAGLPNYDCYCDITCRSFGDCCQDIEETCPLMAVLPEFGELNVLDIKLFIELSFET